MWTSLWIQTGPVKQVWPWVMRLSSAEAILKRADSWGLPASSPLDSWKNILQTWKGFWRAHHSAYYRNRLLISCLLECTRRVLCSQNQWEGGEWGSENSHESWAAGNTWLGHTTGKTTWVVELLLKKPQPALTFQRTLNPAASILNSVPTLDCCISPSRWQILVGASNWPIWITCLPSPSCSPAFHLVFHKCEF